MSNPLMSAETVGGQNRENPLGKRDHLSQRIISAIVYGYFRHYHHLEIKLHPDFPMIGPSLALMAHFSYLDAALFPADPLRPRAIPVVKKELMEIPGIGWALSQWEAIPVGRNGQDIAGVRKIFKAFKADRSVCIAVEGTRSRTGRLGPMNETAVAIALNANNRQIPVFPIAVIGTDEALPPGSWFPRPRRITVVSGPLIDLNKYSGQKLSGNDLVSPARAIRESIAALLPERNKPLYGSSVLAKLAVR